MYWLKRENKFLNINAVQSNPILFMMIRINTTACIYYESKREKNTKIGDNDGEKILSIGLHKRSTKWWWHTINFDHKMYIVRQLYNAHSFFFFYSGTTISYTIFRPFSIYLYYCVCVCVRSRILTKWKNKLKKW